MASRGKKTNHSSNNLHKFIQRIQLVLDSVHNKTVNDLAALKTPLHPSSNRSWLSAYAYLKLICEICWHARLHAVCVLPFLNFKRVLQCYMKPAPMLHVACPNGTRSLSYYMALNLGMWRNKSGKAWQQWRYGLWDAYCEYVELNYQGH